LRILWNIYLSVRQARDNLYKLIDEVSEHHNPVLIAGTRNNVVLVSQEDWDAIQETIYLNSIPNTVDSIQSAAQEPIEDCIDAKELDW
jgi:prevent-host-death family protein